MIFPNLVSAQDATDRLTLPRSSLILTRSTPEFRTQLRKLVQEDTLQVASAAAADGGARDSRM